MVGQKILDHLAEKTNTHISATRISFSRFKDLKIKNLYIEDQKGDTLLFAPLAVAQLDSLNKSERFINIASLKLTSAQLNIAQYSDNEFNFSFFIDSISQPNKPDSLRWRVEIADVLLSNNTIETISQDLDTVGFDNFTADLSLSKQSISVNQLAFLLDNGFQLNRLESVAILDKHSLSIPSLSLETPHSSLIVRDILLKSEAAMLMNSSLDSLHLTLKSNQSFVSAKDLNCFIPQKYKLQQGIVIDGELSASLAHIQGDHLHFKLDSLIDFKGDLTVNNILSDSMINYSLLIDTLKADVENAAAYYSLISNTTLDVADYKHWESIYYSGALIGDAKKLNVKGDIKTKYGTLKPSFVVHLADSSRVFSYSGDLSTHQFRLGKALHNENLFDRFAINLHLEGYAHQHGMMHYFLAQLPTFDYNGYRYRNVELEGISDTNYLNTVISIDDPNVQVNFSGEINWNQENPEYLFSLMASKIDLAAVHLIDGYENFIVRFDSHTQLEGNTIDELNGYSDCYELSIATESGVFNTDSLHFTFKPQDAQPSIKLQSDYLNAELLGSYNFAELPGFINQSLHQHLRHLPVRFGAPENVTPNDFRFNIQVADLYKLAEAIDFPITANGNTNISGSLNSRLNTFNVSADIPYLMTSSQLMDSITLLIHQDYAQLSTSLDVEQISFIGDHSIRNFEVNSILSDDTLDLSVTWQDKAEKQTIADFNSNIFILPYGQEFMGVLDIKPSSFILSDAMWSMDASTITYIKDRIHVDDFRLHNGGSHLIADGIYSDASDDTLFFDLNVFDLAYLNQFFNIKNTSFSGLMSGEAALYQLSGKPAMNSKIEIEETRFNDADFGHVMMSSAWNNTEEALEIELNSFLDTLLALSIAGNYYPERDSLSTLANFSGFPINFLQPYLEHTLANLNGKMYGALEVNGPLIDPALKGAVNVEEGQFRIDYLSTDYTLNDSIYFDDHQFVFKSTQIQDQEGNQAQVDGVIAHTGYRNMMVDLQLKSNRFLALNNSAEENEYFYGDIYYSGLITISSTEKETRIGSTATTAAGSKLTVPLAPVSVANTNNFVRYKQTEKKEVLERRKMLTLDEVYVPKRDLVIDMDFEITEDALVKLELNSESGEVIRGLGNGNLNVQFERGQPFQMFGEYEISQGEYVFSLQQLFNKRFDIIAGSTMRWSGRPGNAVMDITGKYSTKASLYNLMPDAIGETNKNRRVPVNVKLYLQGLLSQPDIMFDIELPSTNEQTQQSVSSIINTEEEISRQVLSLLIMNSFYTPEYYTDATSSGAQTNNQISSVAAVTASEFLSRQLSNWVSQISSNFDLGFYYMPGQELSDQGMTPKEYEMAISSQFFNDRLVVNSNFGYQDYTNTTRPSNLNSSFIGEIDVELKLNDKLKLKAYSHQNDDILYESSTLKQGVGISYQEDFENLAELEERYKQGLRKLFSKKNKRNSEATERKEEEMMEEE